MKWENNVLIHRGISLVQEIQIWFDNMNLYNITAIIWIYLGEEKCLV